MNEQEGQMQNTPTCTSTPSFNHLDSLLDFKFEPLVDADDSGFDSEYDSGLDDLLHSEDEDERLTGATSPNETLRGQDINTDTEIEEDNDHYYQHLDTHLRTLACKFQSEFIQQPKSTQLILAHEVSRLYRSYQEHGSAARLSASIMAYLEGGDKVLRPAKRTVEEEEVNADGVKTGRKRTVEKNVIERATLRFVPLPKVGVSLEEMQREKDGMQREGNVGGKRKEFEGEAQVRNKRRDGPMGGVNNGLGPVGDKRPRWTDMKERESPIQLKAATKANSDDGNDVMDVGEPSGRNTLPQRRSGFGSTLSDHPGPQSQHYMATQLKSGLSRQQPDQELGHAQPRHNTGQRQPRAPSQSTNKPQTPTQSPSPPTTITNNDLTIPPHLYSLTTDPETQSLLLGREPTIPFRPLSSLKITLPSRPPNHPPYPPSLVPTLHRILSLHSLSATNFYHHLLDKYTIPPTLSNPRPPQPPAALFRLAITTRLHTNLSETFCPMVEHEMALDPRTRALFKDVFEGKARGRLNAVEKGVLARAGGVDEEAVERFWEHRGKSRVAWNSLRVWVEMVEAEKIRCARERSGY